MNVYLTLAEVESYLRKSAQAVGLDWGLAEEAGKAARWLAAFGLPGPECMVSHLANLPGLDYQRFTPEATDLPWKASGGVLCPVITGAAIADRSAQMLAGKQFELAAVAYPLLLAATIGQAARCHQTVFTTAWDDVRVSCFANGIRVEGPLEQLIVEQTDSVHCFQDSLSEPQSLPSARAYPIDADHFQQIERLAIKTYAPATEASRAGAGAGLTDND